jgi:predicted CXXCH cytochrome family protein
MTKPIANSDGAGMHRLTFVFLAVVACIAALPPAAGAQLEQSSKKECAMCHVMWLDTFRSEQGTLIEWQPGNVLMKETGGVVSSEEICYSCHDGYVLDSRAVAWKGNNHTTFEKPPDSMTVPERLPLSNKDEIYCGTCHTPHAMHKDEEPVDMNAIAGTLRFLRTPNKDSRMCEKCHQSQAEFKRTKGHPVHTDALEIPETLFELGSVKSQKPDTVICQSCHRVHGAPGENLTVMENSESRLCRSCHEEETIIETQHDLRRSMPDARNIRDEAASGVGPCRGCHVPHDSAGYKLWARKLPAGNPASGSCLSCHRETGENREDAITGTGRYTHPNDIEIEAEDRPVKNGSAKSAGLPFYAEDGEEEPAGKLQCATCHNPHQWDPVDPAEKGGTDAEGTPADSFLRIPADQGSALCVACHKEKERLLFHDHNLLLTAPEAENMKGLSASASGACGVCHIAHNAGGKRLWAREGPVRAAPENPFCTGCHTENGAAEEKPVGKADHPVNISAKNENLPPLDAVSQILPLYNAEGGEDGGERIACRTCHDPHTWSPTPEGSKYADSAFQSRDDPAKIEGDATNSFLRMSASPAPDLCSVCHKSAALLVGTDHDLMVTAPESRNRMEQSVLASGKCGACHAVHNSPEKRILWARRLGPVAEGQHSMNAVCTSCHQEGGVAEKKVPPVASHPSGYLITNVMWYDGEPTGYIKIFDSDWKEVNVGDLSCSSCHSFSAWSYEKLQQGPGKNIEGNASTSFLRAPSHNTVCIDCHGETAPWRYTYFHSVEKREMLEGRKP